MRRQKIIPYSERGVVVLAVAGRLSDVVEDLDQEIRLALAEGPRGVVCDLSAVGECADRGAVEVLASAGRHLGDWSGIPLAVACPDPRVREVLVAHRVGGRLIVTASLFAAVSMVRLRPRPACERLRLAPDPTAAGASRDFVTRTLLDWGLGRLALPANLVVTELVTSTAMHATADIELSIAWNLRALRLTVRGNDRHQPGQPFAHLGPDRSRRSAVVSLSRAFGVLPSADGGNVVWAVLDAGRLSPVTGPRPPELVSAYQEQFP